jgi:predicted nucleic acid-binding protein
MEKAAFMRGFVLDTSVVLKWFSAVGEKDLDQALQLRRKMSEGTVFFVVPELLFYELANALRYNPNFSASDVKEALDSLLDMEFEIRRVDKKGMEEATAVAIKYNITVYDACFIALSRAEGKPLITADYKLADRIEGQKGIMRLMDI